MRFFFLIYFQVHADSLKYTTHLTELGKLWVKLFTNKLFDILYPPPPPPPPPATHTHPWAILKIP